VSRTPRVCAAVASLLAIVLLLAACSSSGGPSDGTDRSLSTAVPDLPTDLPTTASALAKLMAHGLSLTGTAHLTISATSHSLAIHGAGSVALVNGQVTGLDVTADIGSLHAVRMIEVNSVNYARLPKPAHAGKPWSAVPATGGSAQLRKVHSAIAATEQLGESANVLSLVAAGHVSLRGKGTVGTIAAAHYLVTTRVAALPRTARIRATLLRQGVRSMRLDLWVDGEGRPLTVRDTPTPGGATSGTARFRSYNRSVTFTAPNAKLVAHGG
jgi:hypothetical protein